MFAIEKDLIALRWYADLKDPSDDEGAKLHAEINLLSRNLTELELRLRRNIVFAPETGGKVIEAANKCLELIASLLNTKSGNLDDIVNQMNDFNVLARAAHAEMLGLEEVNI